MNADVILANGGVAGLLVAIAAVGKLSLDWWKSRHDVKDADELQVLTRGTTAVADANSVNAMVLSSLEGVTKENARLLKKVETLERQNAAKDQKIRDLETKLASALDEIHAIAAELAALKST